MSLPYQAVIFDLDGLVLDTESTYQWAWEQVAQQWGVQFPAGFFESLSGQSHSVVATALQSVCAERVALARFFSDSRTAWYRYVQQHGIAVQPGFEAALAAIRQRGWPYALATNSPGQIARDCLNYAGLNGVFDCIISRDDVQQAKPAPDIFLAAAQRLQVNPKNCLVLEDSWVGLHAAQQAGMTALLIQAHPARRAAVQLANPISLDSLQALGAYLDQLSAACVESTD